MSEPSIDSKSDAWTVQRVLNWSVDYLRQKGCPSPRLDSEVLLAASLSCKRIELYTNFDKPMAHSERSTFRNMLRRRAASEPVAYILGFKEFFGRAFKVNGDVLIPRPETEHLVELVRDYVQASTWTAPVRILDLGTGSGCIAVSIALTLPQAQLVAWDISRDALVLAAKNAADHQVEGSVKFIERDMLDPRSWLEARDSFDIIVANPPYIAEHERPQLPPDVVAFEPSVALFGGAEGLDYYGVIAKHAKHSLKAGGQLYLEIGAAQGAALIAILTSEGWQNIKVLPDLAGLPRIVTANLESGRGMA